MRPLCLLVLASSSAFAAPALVGDRAVIVGRVDDGAWNDAPTEGRLDQRAELAVIARGAGRHSGPDVAKHIVVAAHPEDGPPTVQDGVIAPTDRLHVSRRRQRKRLFHVEGARRDATQRDQVRAAAQVLAQIVREGSDVGAAAHGEGGASARPSSHVRTCCRFSYQSLVSTWATFQPNALSSFGFNTSRSSKFVS